MDAHALIIDDDRFNAEVIASMLAPLNILSTIITDTRDLPDILASLDEVHIIFLDLEMPNYNGYELLDILREDPHLADKPIVACTVHTNEINQARRLGFHSFIGKPLRHNLFPDQVQRILSNEPVWEIT